jgi:hypothetical protein
MINMALKWHHIIICNKVNSYSGHLTWFLVCLNMITPIGRCKVSLNVNQDVVRAYNKVHTK